MNYTLLACKHTNERLWFNKIKWDVTLQTVGCCKLYDLITASLFFLILLLLFSGFQEKQFVSNKPNVAIRNLN